MTNKVNKLPSLFIIILVITALFSCGKKEDSSNKDNEQSDTNETAVINENDYSESDEDLLNVDYKEFYDELAPHGEWIEVTDKDIGVEMKKGTASGESGNRKISISELFGIKDAYADEVSFGSFFIWKPSPNLAVTVTAGDPAPQYVPYSNGNWVYTDAGWYFKAPTPYEEVCHHHGRWVYSPALGWVWMPGRVWAPAWVDWRENDNYIAWTPVPPGIYIVNNVVVCPPVPEDRYFVCEKRYFVEPGVYKYMYKENKNKIMIKEWRKVDGVTVMNKTVINKGPDITVMRKVTGKDISEVKLKKVKNKNEVKYSTTEIDTYSPQFGKVKDSKGENRKNVKPDKFVNFGDVKNKGSEHKTKESEDVDKSKGKNKNETGDKGKDKGKIKSDEKSKVKDDKSKGKENKIKENKKSGNDRDIDKGNKNREKNDKGSKQNNDKGGRDKGKKK